MQLVVLTGDIVASSDMDASELDSVIDAIQGASSKMGDWIGAGMTVQFARRSGDSWQVACPAPTYAIRAALFLQANVRRLHKTYATRIAVAIGDGNLPTKTPPDLNSAHGPAFTASGRLLDSISGSQLMTFAASPEKAAILELCSHIARGWTTAQARALCEMLPPQPGTRAEAGAHLGISRQAVDQALWSAGFTAIDAALQHLEAQ